MSRYSRTELRAMASIVLWCLSNGDRRALELILQIHLITGFGPDEIFERIEGLVYA